MNQQLKIISSLFLTSVLASCASSDESPFGTGETPSTIGIASEKGMQLVFSDPQPEIFGTDGYTVTTVDVTVYLYDRYGAQIVGQTVNIDSEWGGFPTGKTCTTDSSGSCSVTWLSGPSGEAPSDLYVQFVAYTTGEEEFLDSNFNLTFDNPDTFNTATNDLPEVFIDCDRDGIFTSGQDIYLNADNDGVYTTTNGLFDGPYCSDTTGRCGNSISYIWVSSVIDANTFATANPAFTTNTCVQ